MTQDAATRNIEPAVGLNVPRVRHLTIRSLSLYSAAPAIQVSFDSGVVCLAGANGVGKSTFLATLNYAITGIVPKPGLRFLSLQQYYDNSLPFAAEYFSGRVHEDDREAAEVEAELDIGTRRYVVTRGLFEHSALRTLRIRDMDDDGQGDTYPDLSGSELELEYQRCAAADMGVAKFHQLAFLQHFVLTFDERRHPLFWDPDVLEQSLHLAFGVDTEKGLRVDAVRRDMERAGSLARNYQWQATGISKRLRDAQVGLRSSQQTDQAVKALLASHDAIRRQREEVAATKARLESELRDANIRLASVSAAQATIRTQYDEEFARVVGGEPAVFSHPLVQSSIQNQECALCGTRGAAVVTRLSELKDARACPLCGSGLKNQQRAAMDVTQLQALDQELTRRREAIDEVTKTITRLTPELQQAESENLRLEQQLSDFERDNDRALTSARRSTHPERFDALVDAFKLQLADLLHRRDEEYKRRDARLAELKSLQEPVKQSYIQAEAQFVPRFRDLAHSFLGLDLDIRMESGSELRIGLVLDLKDSVRRQQHQLSESQRFFVDIALRMALVHQMARSSNGVMLVDTPEGALDIAYESRAGEMFALFVEAGHSIIMTANINSSQLLLRLAERCGEERMDLIRMTSWTELSSVQVAGAALFERAFSEIEQRLTQSVNSDGNSVA